LTTVSSKLSKRLYGSSNVSWWTKRIKTAIKGEFSTVQLPDSKKKDFYVPTPLRPVYS
jgi:hypothetical protein